MSSVWAIWSCWLGALKSSDCEQRGRVAAGRRQQLPAVAVDLGLEAGDVGLRAVTACCVRVEHAGETLLGLLEHGRA